jgi:DNA repair protein RecO (recombination protein O)
MLTSSEAILLDIFDLQENDRIVTLIAPELGKLRGVARGARRKYSRFAGNLQPLAKAKVTWFLKEGRDLARISAVELIRPVHRLQQDLEGILLGACMAGQVLEFAQENEPSQHLYRLLDTTLDALLAGADRYVATRYFEVWVLRLAGLFPAPHRCPVTGRAFGEDGAVVPLSGEGLVAPEAAPSGGYAVSRSTLDFLLRVGRENVRQVAATPPPPFVLEQVEEATGRIRRAFLQHEIKSYRVMKETLARCAPSKT